MEHDHGTKPKDDCIIGVGYTACTDISFVAKDLIQILEPEIEEMENRENLEIVPKVHEKITNLREFIETFAYQFSNGANAERVS